MRTVLLTLAALVLTACATTDESANEQNDAVQDFIQLHGLDKVSSVRNFENPGHLIVNRRYIIAYMRDDRQFLLEYAHDCKMAEMSSGGRMPDTRRRGRTLSVRTDTFRGCPVRAMFPITLPQAEELMAIGQGPGETAN